MKFKTIALLFIALKIFSAGAQTCNCTTDFAAVENAYKNDYAGIQDFMATHPNYLQIFTHISNQAKATNDVKRCDELIKQFVSYLDNGHVYYGKTNKNPLYKKETKKQANSLNPTLQFLDDKTAYIQIKTCDLSYKSQLDSLVSLNYTKLNKIPHFIIDLRGNDGGGDAMFDTLIPYLYTNPILCYSANLWASSHNTQMFAEFLSNPDIDADTKTTIQKIIAQANANPNTFVPMSPNKVDSLVYTHVSLFPKKVSILVDYNCASATEQFLLLAKQSKKTTIYGYENTAGCLDYANVNIIFTPSGYWYIGVPTTRSARLPQNPVDPMGIKPDILVDKKITNLIDYVQKK